MPISSPSLVLVIGSPHNHGSTHHAARFVQTLCEQKGYHTHTLELWNKHYLGCTHCGACTKAPFRCVLAKHDDCEQSFALLQKSDLVLWFSPIYFYGLPAQAKALIDRSQRFFEQQRISKQQPCVSTKAAAVLLSGQVHGQELFTGARLALKYFFQTLGIEYLGHSEIRGIDSFRDFGLEQTQHLLTWTTTLIQGLGYSVEH